ncbi:hypothetical protein HRG_003580 [Hirsutella rhossiliensis]|uniref:Uncharacterized protein n=1 Tax=Hirsutella rhossiliensis TaxID=111463 RepID=A0A9P8N4A7_9HYPO|nr:uncharacterized protein HRG_03580 [Hirsutella rhossiliensis]KAH0965564.1 hypothetical protein HRG_03580 [Hirsutella rhossiliensis]
MASSGPSVFPWECRDKEDQARISYHHPLRRTNQALAEENMKLKRILRENGISWSSVAQAHLKQRDPNMRKTRSSRSAHELGRPCLPTEVILRILKLSMKSSHPIIDPLSPLTPEHLSDQEKARGNQIAIHFLATCKALHTEGTRYLWEGNTFVFTTAQALRNFAELTPRFRSSVTHVNLRIVARYYDDQRRRHKLERCYHADLKKDQLLKIVDFLAALRAPYDPAYRDKKNPRPRLLPSLSSLRLDLVNFSDTLLPFSGSELHDIASHELGCTLNELQVTGMPFDDAGMKASAELSGMLKDEGLYLDGPPSFIAHVRYLQPLSGNKWCARVIRAWKGNGTDSDYGDITDEDMDDHVAHFSGYHPRLGALPPAPLEEGHPPSTRDEETVIWKRVPTSRDGGARSWVQFSRFSGYEITDPDWDTDDEGICPCCGESHPGSSFLEFLVDDDLAD